MNMRRLIDAVGGAHGVYRVMAGIMYGSGMRLMERCRLRVKDGDFERGPSRRSFVRRRRVRSTGGLGFISRTWHKGWGELVCRMRSSVSHLAQRTS